MAGDLKAMQDLLSDEELPEYLKAELTPTETLALVGRSMTVASEVLDGVAHDPDATGRKPLKAFAIAGRIVLGVARIVTPGSLEGSLYRHGMALAALVDLFLVVFATLGLVDWRFALTAIGYTALVAAVAEGTRYVTHGKGTATQRLKRLLGIVAVVFVGLLGLSILLIWNGWILDGPQTRLLLDRFGHQGPSVAALALGASALVAVGLVWGRFLGQRPGQGAGWIVPAFASAAPLVLFYGLMAATRLVLPNSFEAWAPPLVGALVASAIMGSFTVNLIDVDPSKLVLILKGVAVIVLSIIGGRLIIENSGQGTFFVSVLLLLIGVPTLLTRASGNG